MLQQIQRHDNVMQTSSIFDYCQVDSDVADTLLFITTSNIIIRGLREGTGRRFIQDNILLCTHRLFGTREIL